MPDRKEEVVSLTRDGLTRRVGMPVNRKITYGLLLIPAATTISLLLIYLIKGWILIAEAIVAGVITGIFPLGVTFVVVSLGRKLWPAICICSALQCAFAIVSAVRLSWRATPPEIILYTWLGFGLGLIIVRAWGPREKVYRYAQCPGCEYDLALLPKSDVCPECGRDNSDLVEIFMDIDTQQLPYQG